MTGFSALQRILPQYGMYIVIIAWMYVVLMAAIVEAVGAGGSLLGAGVTLLFWGVLPASVVAYLMGSPARRAAKRAAEASAAGAVDPDDGGHAAGDTVAAERKEP